MSKQSWLPTSKGIDLFPKVIQAPTRLVIRGVPPDSPLYHDVASHFSGRLKQFHAKAQQAHALSVNEISRQRIEWMDGRAICTNIQGHENLELEVDLTSFVSNKKEDFVPWDWALLNLKVESAANAEFVAYMRVPLLSNPPIIGKGVTICNSGSGQGDKPVSFPDVSNAKFKQLAPVTVAGSFTEASLLVDMRVVDRQSGVVVDIYGKLPDSGAAQCGAQKIDFPVTYTIALPSPLPQPVSGGDTTVDAAIQWFIQGFIKFRWPDCTIGKKVFYIGSEENNFGGNFGLGFVEPTYSTTLAVSSIIDGTTEITITARRVGSTLTITLDNPDKILSLYGIWDDRWLTPTSWDGSDGTSPTDGSNSGGWWVLHIVGVDGVNGWTSSSAYAASVSIATAIQSGSPAATDTPGFSVQGTNVLVYDLYFVPYLEAGIAPTPADISTVTDPLIVSGLVGRGEPDWSFSEHDSDDSVFHTWERRELYPRSPPLVTLRSDLMITNHPISSILTDPLFGYPYLGTLVADRRWGGIAFNKKL